MNIPLKGKCINCGKKVNLVFGPKPIIERLNEEFPKRDYAVMGCEIFSPKELKKQILCVKCMEKSAVK